MDRISIVDSLLENKRKRGRPRKKKQIVSSRVGDDIIARLIAEVRQEEQDMKKQEEKNKKLNQDNANK
jgi:hypothetical protein